MSRRDSDFTPTIVLVAAAICLLLALVGAVLAHRAEVRRCHRGGGHFEPRNCHEVDDESCIDFGDGNVSCFYSGHHTSCDQVCVDLQPEAVDP